MVAAVAAVATVGTGTSDGAVEAGSPAVAAATALSTSSRRLVGLTNPALTIRRARRFAERRQRAIPLPAGGNFHGIRWHNAQRPITPGAVEQVLEYNARCQWLRAAAERREPAAAQVARLADRWPALRVLPPEPSLLASCYGSHWREMRHARELGLVPST